MRFLVRKSAWTVYKASVLRLVAKEKRDSDLVISNLDMIWRCWDVITGYRGEINPRTITAFSAFSAAVGVFNEALGINVDPLLIISPEKGKEE